MVGFPKHFETKQDYLNSLQMFPEKTKDALRTLYADRYKWEKGAKLKSKDAGKEDAEHIVSCEPDKDGNDVYYQFNKVVDKNAQVYKLGFTDSEIKKLL